MTQIQASSVAISTYIFMCGSDCLFVWQWNVQIYRWTLVLVRAIYSSKIKLCINSIDGRQYILSLAVFLLMYVQYEQNTSRWLNWYVLKHSNMMHSQYLLNILILKNLLFPPMYIQQLSPSKYLHSHFESNWLKLTYI